MARTPKADASAVCLESDNQGHETCIITGDPVHDEIAFRAAVSHWANDASDLLFDHKDMLIRLSAPDGPTKTPTSRRRNRKRLGKHGRALLAKAVCCTSRKLRKLRQALPRASRAVTKFLERSHVLQAPEWLELFGARRPPRGTLARLARRFEAELHPNNGRHGYSILQDFKDEALSIQEWYPPGRRKKRFRGMHTHPSGPKAYARGKGTAWTRKVSEHYRRLLKPIRLEGLWNWRVVARALILAVIAVHSGTVPVERLWSSSLAYFPEAARSMSLAWFELLAELEFLWYNYRHFNHSHLPTWTEGDALLASRVENMCDLVNAWNDDESGCDLLCLLRDAFSPVVGGALPFDACADSDDEAVVLSDLAPDVGGTPPFPACADSDHEPVVLSALSPVVGLAPPPDACADSDAELLVLQCH